MRLLPLAAATVLAGSLYAADPQLLSMAMPDSRVMAGVNFEQAVLSPLGQFLQALTGRLPNPGFTWLTESAGFDPRWDLREILVSSNGLTGGNSIIVLSRGTFNVPKIIAAFQAGGGTIETYKGVPIVGKQDGWAFPDSTLAINGNVDSLRAAIDRMSAPASINSTLAAQVNQLSTTEDAWFVSMAPLSEFQQKPSAVTGDAGPFAIIAKVQQSSGGVKFGANVAISLQAVSQTDQDAAALAAVLKSLPALVQMGGSKRQVPDVAALLQSLNVTTEGHVTKISMSVPETQIEEAMQAANAGQPPPSKPPDAPVRAQPFVRDQTTPVEQSVPPSAASVPERIRVGSNVQKAKLLQHSEPVYPPLALQARISGVVHLNAVIGKDGTVRKLTVASGHPLLVPAAMEAVKQWVYAPSLLNGQPVEVVTQVEVNFNLEQ
jgi:TonB family protein